MGCDVQCRVRRLLWIAVVSLSATVTSAAPASAVSCAPHADASPTAIAAGTERLSGDAGFFENWHHLLLGRVVGVTTDGEESPTAGRTTWTVEVAAALGQGEVASRIDVVAQDAGGNAGYAFTVGDAFAIPVGGVERLGYWSSFGCDPITSLDDLDGTVEEVLAVAAERGTPVATVVGGDALIDAGTAVAASAAVVLVVVAGGGAVVLRRRRRANIPERL